MTICSDWARGGWLLAVAALVATASPVVSAQADDFDDDFAQGPTTTSQDAQSQPRNTAPDTAADDFDDDFDDSDSSSGPTPASRKPAASDDFDDDFAADAAASGAVSVGARGADEASDDAANDGVVDPFEEDHAAQPGSSRRRQLRAHNTYHGPTGGIRVVDAAGGAEDSFRFALSTELFMKDGFLVANDDHSRTGGALTFSLTPLSFLEVAASIVAYASSNEQEDPSLFQVLGDTRVFLKGFGWATRWLSLGGDVELALLNGIGEVGLSGRGTSVGLRLNASADLRNIPREVPLIFRYNLRYYFDNSAKLISDVERARYDNLLDPLPQRDEHRHLLTNVERYAFTINRVDTLSMSFGMEAPLQVKGEYYLHPLLEWSFSLPANRQGYNCVFRPFDPEERDSCLAEQGFAARAATLTVGARFLPPVRGLSFMTAFDIGTSGTSTFVRELAPNSAWMWLNGFSYTYDLRPPTPKVVTREVALEPKQKAQGRIRGRILETEGEAPVAGAIVRFEDPGISPLLSGSDGAFVTYRFDPGTIRLQLSSDEHEPTTCEATLPEDGSSAEVICKMVALPKLGAASITLRDDGGATLSGVTFSVAGAGQTRAVSTDSSGAAELLDLPPGEYSVLIDAEDYLARRSSFTVQARETTKVDIALLKKPRASLVRLSKSRIAIKRQVLFETDSARIKVQSHALLAQVADVMLRHEEIRKVEIQGHTDNTGASAYNQTLSQQRAESVREWLIGAGVEPERMTAVGYGDTKPLAPNIIPANRAKNRRVQFDILERADAGPPD